MTERHTYTSLQPLVAGDPVKKYGKMVSIERIIHSPNEGASSNHQEISLCVYGVPIATWNRNAAHSVLINVNAAVEDGRATPRQIADTLRKWIPDVWVGQAEQDGWCRMDAYPWVISKPFTYTYGAASGASVMLGGQAWIEWPDEYDYMTSTWVEKEAVIHGVVPLSVMGYNYHRSHCAAVALKRHKRAVRAAERRIERKVEALQALFYTALGSLSWERNAHVRNVKKWLARYDRSTYTIDGVEYVDLYKGTVYRNGDEFSSASINYKTGKPVSYAPGTTPHAEDWDPSPSCGNGLHLCADTDSVRGYVGYRHLVICPVRVDDIVVIGSPKWADKCKVPNVALPIKGQGQVIV